MSCLGDNSLKLNGSCFDYEKAELKKSAILNNFEDKFDKFKNEMKKVFGNELPETKKNLSGYLKK